MACVACAAFFIGGAPQLKNKNLLFATAKVCLECGELFFVYCFLPLTVIEPSRSLAPSLHQDERIRISTVSIGTLQLEIDVILRNFEAHDVKWE